MQRWRWMDGREQRAGNPGESWASSPILRDPTKTSTGIFVCFYPSLLDEPILTQTLEGLGRNFLP
jgi:hypothetical protein